MSVSGEDTLSTGQPLRKSKPAQEQCELKLTNGSFHVPLVLSHLENYYTNSSHFSWSGLTTSNSEPQISFALNFYFFLYNSN